ncbi:MAG TPA: S8 family peptidase [Longimicrobiaceae bacterium]|nr:S8 family peptidase [Longimicrobiaceae bacterium]
MRSICTLLLAGPFLALAACADEGSSPVTARDASAPVLAASENGQGIPGQYIVVLKDGADPRSVAAVAGVSPKYIYTAALNGFAGALNAGQLNALQHNPSVAYIEQDQVMSVATTQSNATWGIDRVDQRALPLSKTFTYLNTGVGVNAYIIDTGIRYDHAEFGGRAVKGFDAVTAGGTAADCQGHGTHVAGTVGGTTWGVAKAVKLYSVRVLDCSGSGTSSGVAAGMDWVAANHVKPAVANMSLGGGGSTVIDDATRRMIAAGVSTTIAAGNGNLVGIAQDACNYSPARVAEGITIGATTSSDAKASYSNYGNCVDFFAPGSSITSADYSSTTGSKVLSGTSMAAPHVAGAAALFLQSRPGATPQQVRDSLYANTTKGIVTSSKTANNHLLFTSY